MDSAALIQFLLASVLLTLSPGPDILYVLSSSLRRGFSTGFFIALGLCSGLVIHTSLVGFGVATIIQQDVFWQWILKIFGAAYMLWLAYKIYRSDASIVLENQTIDLKSGRSFYLQGFLMNVLNPKVTLFFLAFLPQFIKSDAGPLFSQALLLGFLFFLQALIIFSLVAFFAGSLAGKIAQNQRFQLLIKYFQVVLFVLLAFGIAFIA